jgi:general secretion pathway protein B
MSFILDALRKSETERQRQSGPGLAEAGYRPPARRRALWMPLLVVVLLANVVLMGLLWLRDSPTAPAQPAAGTSPAAATDSAPAAQTPAQRPVAAAVPANAEDAYEAMADVPALEPEAVAPPVAAASGMAVADPPLAPPAPATGSQFVSDGLPTAEQLVAAGALSTQPMHLDIHVFSDAPAERFVFINMRKYTEGALLPEGPRIEEITREGVVLNQSGQRFVLTRE